MQEWASSAVSAIVHFCGDDNVNKSLQLGKLGPACLACVFWRTKCGSQGWLCCSSDLCSAGYKIKIKRDIHCDLFDTVGSEHDEILGYHF